MITTIILAIYFILLSLRVTIEPVMIAFLVIITLVVASFSTLNVQVDPDFLKIKFGIGIIRKKFKIKDITEVKTVRNKWFYGYGIRYVFWVPCWLFNVSGLNAVQIKLNNKIYRIGTDEPKTLEKEIKQYI